MSHHPSTWSRIPRWQKLAFLAPVVAVVAMWSSGIGSSADRDPRAASPTALPTIPTDGFEAPASVTRAASPTDGSLRPGASNGGTVQVGADPTAEGVDGIPTAALLAYQRVEAVLAQADPTCHLTWELVAAIGRVESDHGRYGDSTLTEDGRSEPGIYGIALNGRDGVALISDSDRGVLDQDQVFDRAVGPMQFIPTTWGLVGVDGDGDEVRDPQDIDDAALAAGVYLCAGDLDLSTAEGLRVAIHGYNHSDSYVTVVLAIMRAYAAGSFAEVDNTAPANGALAVAPDDQGSQGPDPSRPDRHGERPDHNPGADDGGDGPGGGDHYPGGGGGNNPGGGNHGGTGANNAGGNGGTGGGDDGPPKPVEDTVTETVDPVVKATARCTAALTNAGIDPSGRPLDDCIDAYLEGGMSAVDSLIGDLLDLLDLGILGL